MKGLFDLFTAATGYFSAILDTVEHKDVSISVWTKNGTRNETAPLLGGLFFEDISQSGDGGIYAELIRNRAFQGSGIHLEQVSGIPYSTIVYSENPTLPFGPVLDGWSAIGDMDVMTNATGRVGIRNDGWWGIHVSPQTYETSFHAQASGKRFNWTISNFEVSLESALTGEVWSKSRIPVNNRLYPHRYSWFNTTIHNSAKAPNINNTFSITVDAKEARGQTLFFDLISLFPETYKGRKNGLRKDLAERLADMKPRFLRFPGGNQLEGYSVQRRWKWWKTIGPLEDRPGRPGDWTYYNTDGLGLLEYLEWCEDMEMEPLLAVYDGFSLDIAAYDYGNSSTANEFPIEEMQDVLKEALDELEYCMGGTDTSWGAKRAKHGHPEPFKINMIQIGNEAYFSHRYPERAYFLYEGIKKRYPDMDFVWSGLNESREFEVEIPSGGVWDDHIYAPMRRFIDDFGMFDHFQDHKKLTNVGYALMEYHASLVLKIGNDHPRMGAAVGEAVYHIGGERNPGVFRLSTFAPLIQNLNAWRHTPYDILFTADPSYTTLSTSYYQQQLFNSYHGTHTLPMTLNKGRIDPLFWVASLDEPLQEIYVKVANADEHPRDFELWLDVSFDSVNGTILEPPNPGDALVFNYFEDSTIIPRPISGINILSSGGERESRQGFNWTAPGWSVAVLQVNLKSRSDGTRTEINFQGDLFEDEQNLMQGK